VIRQEAALLINAPGGERESGASHLPLALPANCSQFHAQTLRLIIRRLELNPCFIEKFAGR